MLVKQVSGVVYCCWWLLLCKKSSLVFPQQISRKCRKCASVNVLICWPRISHPYLITSVSLDEDSLWGLFPFVCVPKQISNRIALVLYGAVEVDSLLRIVKRRGGNDVNSAPWNDEDAMLRMVSVSKVQGHFFKKDVLIGPYSCLSIQFHCLKCDHCFGQHTSGTTYIVKNNTWKTARTCITDKSQ